MTDASLRKSFVLAATLMLVPLAPALAHTGTGTAAGFLSGFMHPISGLDHLVAMVAVGLWGAQLGAPAIWVLPITFPLVMAIGGIFGVAGMDLPLTEMMIALSGIALGLAVAGNLRPRLWIAAIVVGVFAVFHGYAHGRELPEAADPLAYGVGFVMATGLLHLCGILIGVLTRWPIGMQLVRGSGALIGAVGGYFFLSALGLIA